MHDACNITRGKELGAVLYNFYGTSDKVFPSRSLILIQSRCSRLPEILSQVIRVFKTVIRNSKYPRFLVSKNSGSIIR
jgi:hypothetical protein